MLSGPWRATPSSILFVVSFSSVAARLRSKGPLPFGRSLDRFASCKDPPPSQHESQILERFDVLRPHFQMQYLSAS
jgi:hypothetical protein